MGQSGQSISDPGRPSRGGPRIRRRLGIVLVVLGTGGLVTGLAGQLKWQSGGEPAPTATGASIEATPESSSPPVGGEGGIPAPVPSVAREAPDRTSEPDEPTSADEPQETIEPITVEEPQESVEDFLTILEVGIATTDIELLLSRLHPDVIARYGTEQCRDHLAGQGDPSYGLALVAASDSDSWSYASDGETTTVADAITVTVDQTRSDDTTRRDIHISRFEGALRWFSDCGTPVA